MVVRVATGRAQQLGGSANAMEGTRSVSNSNTPLKPCDTVDFLSRSNKLDIIGEVWIG
ncbi:hypothetical protein ACLOJK_005542 [Asimina triloba]